MSEVRPSLLDALDGIPAALIPAAIARLAARAMEPPVVETRADDVLLTPDEVAALLKADRRFVYRHARALGGIRLSRRKLRFSAERVQRYIATRR